MCQSLSSDNKLAFALDGLLSNAGSVTWFNQILTVYKIWSVASFYFEYCTMNEYFNICWQHFGKID